ncbi:MAG: hypothetical protein IT336_01985 [Thermomicrobiales bacterium]|nr:hypothetical protein [Thermomicrobiales bacterium]
MIQRWSPPNRIRFALACALAIVTAVAVVGLDPASTPAADPDTDTELIAIEATPVAIESTEPEQPPCPPDGQVSLVTTVDDPNGSPAAATPIATDDDQPIDCAPVEQAPAGDETVDDSQPAPPETDGAVGSEPAIPDDPVADAVDPFLTGLPWQDANAPVIDPMLAGIITEKTSAPVTDPMLAGLAPSAGSPSIRDIAIEVISMEGTVTPGGHTTYRFRLRNTGTQPVSARPIASTDAGGWRAEVRSLDGSAELTRAIVLAPGVAVDVLVVVIAPEESTVGESATTTLTLLDA